MSFEVIEDSLDLLAAEASDLLHRVDLVIDQLGVPAGHPLTGLMRTLRVRPGEALRMLLATPPADLMGAVDTLRQLAGSYHDDLVAPLDRAAGELGWSGAGYDAFAAHWTATMRDLAGDDKGESLAARLRATAEFTESVAGWLSQTRGALATALAGALSSTEAVILKGCDQLEGDPRALRRAYVTGELDDSGRITVAAANVGALALRPVRAWYQTGVETYVAGPDGVPAGGWAAKLAPLPEPAAPDGAPAGGYAKAVWVRQ
ncbi:MAG: hypothetical protein ACRDT6_25185 [Micromonosporaceae bacterium]